MKNDIDSEKKVGEILPNQGWVYLEGAFTIKELSDLILKINEKYKGPEKKGNKD